MKDKKPINDTKNQNEVDDNSYSTEINKLNLESRPTDDHDEKSSGTTTKIEKELNAVKKQNIKSARSAINKELENLITKPSPLRVLNKFKLNEISSSVKAGGSPAYSLLLTDIQYKDEITDIIKVLKEKNILSESFEKIIKTTYKTKKLLIPQLSENTAIHLANQFKHLHLKLRFGLSESLLEQSPGLTPRRGNFSPSQIMKYSRKSYQIASNSEVLFFTEDLGEEYEVLKQGGLIHVSKTSNPKKHSDDEIIDYLTDQMKDKAKNHHLNAIINTNLKKEKIFVDSIPHVKISIFGIGALIKES